ncbi:MAG: hypothetical protein AAB772_02740 [Patescibacteria group bacterium]
MPKTQKDRQLIEEEKQKIYAVIYALMESNEKHPNDVIKEDFGGNENAYLIRMAKWHDIPL